MAEIVKNSWEGGELTSDKLQEVNNLMLKFINILFNYLV